MSDREIIIQLLRTVEWRIRANRLLNELAIVLSATLAALVIFKIWDLFSPFQALTIEGVLGVLAVSFVFFTAWRTRSVWKRRPLTEAAAVIDHKANLHDALKSALWFINNPRPSHWVDEQIRRAAAQAKGINLSRVYPNAIPRASYSAIIAVLLFAGLNFIPLPFNHNWLMLQAAAPEAAPLVKPAVAGALNREQILKDLKEIAELLRESELLQETADDLAAGDLHGAANDLEKLARGIDKATPEEIEELRQAMKAASRSDKADLQDALQEMGDTSETAEDTGIYEELMETAERLNELAEKLNTPVPEGTQYQTGKTTDDTQGAESVQVSDDVPGEMKRSNTGGPGASNSRPGGLSQLPQSLEAQLQLDVKLQAQALNAIELEAKQTESLKDEEEVAEASKRERSRVDYRDIKSELTPAQKDLLNQAHVPWEYRALIKSYFQSIRPPEKK
jgi:hypothetical protein